MQGKVKWIPLVLKVMKDDAILGYEVLLSICFFTVIKLSLNRCKINVKYEDRDDYSYSDWGEEKDGAEIVQKGVCRQKIHVGCE